MKPVFERNDGPEVYFVLGRAVIMVQHRNTVRRRVTPANLLRQLLRNELIAGNDLLQQGVVAILEASSEEQQRRVISFNPPTMARERSLWSYIYVDIPDTDVKQARLARLLAEVNSAIESDVRQRGNLYIRAVSPDWLLAGAPTHLGGGGPGALPRPYHPSQPNDAGSWHFQLPDQVGDPASLGAGVDVAVLDTAPSACAMAWAYATWGSIDGHPAQLLGPSSVLHVSRAAYADLVEMESYGLKDHQYVMTDHGLFVSSIIHSIAPQANIELIEVLNAYGVGSSRMTADALARLVNEPRTRPLVVNCSLTFIIPQPDELAALQQSDPDLWGWLTPAILEAIRTALQSPCEMLNDQSALMVAAAGNDAHLNNPRPPARYPAAFDTVVGVGALDRDGSITSYSNVADLLTASTASMLTTLGGSFDPSTGPDATGDPNDLPLTDEQNSVLGLYIGDFPQGDNEDGLGLWCGTSFAAPVVSGALAALINGSTTPQQALQQVYAAASTAPVADPSPTGPQPDPAERAFHVVQVVT